MGASISGGLRHIKTSAHKTQYAGEAFTHWAHRERASILPVTGRAIVALGGDADHIISFFLSQWTGFLLMGLFLFYPELNKREKKAYQPQTSGRTCNPDQLESQEFASL